MCGICGIISFEPINKKQAILFQDMMEELQSRGTDANGWVTYPGNKIIKQQGSVSQLLSQKGGKIWNKVIGSKVILGHTRQSTSGCESKNFNNHPFSTEDFVLAHNGMISNYISLKTSYGIKTNIETDSYVIIKLLQHYFDLNKKMDVISAINHTSDKLAGGYSCWVLHKKTGDVYLIKHFNPISFTYIKDWKTIIFASELKHYGKNLVNLPADKLLSFFKTATITKKIDDNRIIKITSSGNISIHPLEISYDYAKNNNFHCNGVFNAHTNTLLLDDDKDTEEDEDETDINYLNGYFEEEFDLLDTLNLNYEQDYISKKIKVNIPEAVKNKFNNAGYTTNINGELSLKFKNLKKFINIARRIL